MLIFITHLYARLSQTSPYSLRLLNTTAPLHRCVGTSTFYPLTRLEKEDQLYESLRTIINAPQNPNPYARRQHNTRDENGRENLILSDTVFYFYPYRFLICGKKRKRDGILREREWNGSMFFHPYFQNPVFYRDIPIFSYLQNTVLGNTKNHKKSIILALLYGMLA